MKPHEASGRIGDFLLVYLLVNGSRVRVASKAIPTPRESNRSAPRITNSCFLCAPVILNGQKLLACKWRIVYSYSCQLVIRTRRWRGRSEESRRGPRGRREQRWWWWWCMRRSTRLTEPGEYLRVRSTLCTVSGLRVDGFRFAPNTVKRPLCALHGTKVQGGSNHTPYKYEYPGRKRVCSTSYDAATTINIPRISITIALSSLHAPRKGHSPRGAGPESCV